MLRPLPLVLFFATCGRKNLVDSSCIGVPNPCLSQFQEETPCTVSATQDSCADLEAICGVSACPQAGCECAVTIGDETCDPTVSVCTNTLSCAGEPTVQCAEIFDLQQCFLVNGCVWIEEGDKTPEPTTATMPLPTSSPVGTTPGSLPTLSPIETSGGVVARTGDNSDAWFCIPDERDPNQFLCIDGPFGDGDPDFPFGGNPESFVLLTCLQDLSVGGGIEPTAATCDCVVVIGTLEDVDNTQICDQCAVLPSDDTTDGLWQASFDCSNVLQGGCVGRDAMGACISSDDGAPFPLQPIPTPTPPPIMPVAEPIDPNPDNMGNNNFFCDEADVFGGIACLYLGDDSFPFDEPESSLFLTCTENIALNDVEPTVDNCECFVFLGDPDENLDPCSCTFVPSADTTDGNWQIAYDCSNALEGECVGRDASGECFEGGPAFVTDDSPPGPFNGGVLGFFCFRQDEIDGFICTYQAEESFPFPETESFLIATCFDNTLLGIEPVDSNCECNIVLGSVLDTDSQVDCQSCSFLPSASTTDGEWQISFDCSNVLEGDCVGRDASGNCISSFGDSSPAPTMGDSSSPAPTVPEVQSGGIFGFFCSRADELDAFICTFATGDDESFPFSNPKSFLIAFCSDVLIGQEPTPELCEECNVIIGDLLDTDTQNNPETCNSCMFLPTPDATDGWWEIAFDCSNILEGSCVGKDANGECISSDDTDPPPAPSVSPEMAPMTPSVVSPTTSSPTLEFLRTPPESSEAPTSSGARSFVGTPLLIFSTMSMMIVWEAIIVVR